jgi:hypothetical protein
MPQWWRSRLDHHACCQREDHHGYPPWTVCAIWMKGCGPSQPAPLLEMKSSGMAIRRQIPPWLVSSMFSPALLPHGDTCICTRSGEFSDRVFTMQSPIRSVMLPLAPVPEFVPEVSNMRVQDIVPEYERANPLYVKLDDTYRRLCENKSELVKIFMELDPKKHGFLSRREFAEGIKRTNQKCKLNIPRVLLDDMCEEAGTMFAPKRDPQDPQNIVYYEQFIAALQAPSPIAERTLEQALEASSPARLMAPTSRFTERARRSEDFTMIERMKAHVIQVSLPHR